MLNVAVRVPPNKVMKLTVVCAYSEEWIDSPDDIERVRSLFLPKRDLRVPLDAITELTFTKSHLGKATMYALLKVRFSVEDRSDSIAWYLTAPRAWKNRIEEVNAGRPTNEGG